MAGPDPAAGAETPAQATQLSQADIRQIFVGIMLAMFLSGLDGTIVATAMPTIGRELGDAAHLPWIVTAYLLASTAVTPLYGKISDMVGRRATMQVAIFVFVAGSIGCALAPTMTLLALGRGVQGLGGGGLVALAQTIVGDMVSPRERGRYQVYFGTVFAMSSVLGPVLGGFFAQSLHWSLIFWINLPLGALAFWLTNERLKKLPRHPRRHRLDVLGALLMVGATVTMMLGVTSGGTRVPWLSLEELSLIGGSVLLWAAFGWRLATAGEPLIPLAVLRDQVVATAAISGALTMGVYLGLAIVVPLYLEAVLGFSARESGWAMIAFMVGVPVGATASGRAMAAVTHYKRVPLAGLALAAASLGTIGIVFGQLGIVALEILFFTASTGLGTVFPVVTVATQNAVAAQHLGTATATMNFFRQLAGVIIVAAFGAIVLGGRTGGSLEGGQGLAAEAAGIRIVFLAAAAGLVLALAVFATMQERPLRGRPAEPGGAAPGAG